MEPTICRASLVPAEALSGCFVEMVPLTITSLSVPIDNGRSDSKGHCKITMIFFLPFH